MYSLVRYGEFVALFDEYFNNFVDLNNNYVLLEQEEDVISLLFRFELLLCVLKVHLLEE